MKNPLIAFLVKAVLLYVLWFLLYDYVIAPSRTIDNWLNKVVGVQSTYVLRAIGYESDTIPGNNQTVVRINEQSMVGVGNPCNGLELFVLFAGFIICFPGSTKSKVWFIPLGMVIIHIANVLRSTSLALIQFHDPASLDFNHHYTFTVIVYSIIFGLWMYWVNRYSGLFDSKPTSEKIDSIEKEV
jgi:exosortase family protein XrtF